MIATAFNRINRQRLRLNGSDLLRMLTAGSVWGITMSAGLAGMSAWNCGMVCLDDVAMTAATSIGTGILAIGPIAAYRRR